jgi:hypothetical protein
VTDQASNEKRTCKPEAKEVRMGLSETLRKQAEKIG